MNTPRTNSDLYPIFDDGFGSQVRVYVNGKYRGYVALTRIEDDGSITLYVYTKEEN